MHMKKPEVEIIKALPDDLDLLIKWRIRVLKEVFALPDNYDAGLIDENRRYYEKHLRDKSHVACFARLRDTGEIIGCGGICYYEEMPSPDNPGGLCGYLMNIYTVPYCRGQGAGGAVVEYLVSNAKARGAGKIYLESSRDGEKLYKQSGFSTMDGYMRL